MYKHCRQMEM